MKFENKRKRIRPKYTGHRQLVKILKIQKGGEPNLWHCQVPQSLAALVRDLPSTKNAF